MKTTQGMIRAYPKALPPAERTPDKLVVGWLLKAYRNYYIIPDGIQLVDSPHVTKLFGTITQIDISTAARATGKMAKGPDGKLIEIFGSDGDMQGGDEVKSNKRAEPGIVHWANVSLTWYVAEGLPLCNCQSGDLEIIPPAKEVD